MTFDTIETSVDDGKPVELLQIAYGASLWLYTTSELPITYGGYVYSPLPMSRGSIKNTGDVAKSTLTVSVPQDTAVGDMFRVQPPSGVVSVTMFAEHHGDNDFKVIWKGRIVNVEWKQPWLNLTVENVFSSLNRIGIRRKYSTQCPHVLYGVGDGMCNVVRATHLHTYTVTSMSGLSITCAAAAGLAENFFAGGYAEWTHNVTGVVERRMIRTSTAAGVITVTSSPSGLAPAGSVDMYPGCDHKLSTCVAKFSNSLNFGGMPHIPTKNPFSSMIY